MESDSLIVKAIDMHSSMRAAAMSISMNYQTFRKHVKRLGLWKTNQSGRGVKKSYPGIPLNEILAGLHPSYKRHNLKRRLFAAGLKKNECEECGQGSTWENKPLTIQLEHVNGVKDDHSWTNLKMLCPNCHSQTSTFSGRNKRHRGGIGRRVSLRS